MGDDRLGVLGGIRAGTGYSLSAARRGLLIAVGRSALLTDAIREILGRAAAEGERQIEVFNGSVGRAGSSLWSWRRASGKASRQGLRAAR